MSIALKPAFRPVEVNLGTDEEPELFETVPQTKALERDTEKLTDKIEEFAIKTMGLALDLQLASTRDEQPKPSELVAAQYKAGSLTLDELQDFAGRIAEAARPTSQEESAPTSTSSGDTAE